MKQILLVMNPCAGQRRATRFLPEIIGRFNAAGFQVIIYMTNARGDAQRWTAAWGKSVDRVVCIGGDGTLNECISGLLQVGLRCPVGYIPAGTTNDFAASLCLPTDIRTAAEAIVEGEPVEYDAGRFGDRYFCYVASFGAFTRTSYSTPQSVKNTLGHLAYVLEGIQEISQIRKNHVRFELEDEVVEDDFIFGAISNSTSVGGILTLDPKQVDMCDGKFELLLVRMPRDLLELGDCIRAIRSQKYDCTNITFRTVSRLRVIADPAMAWSLDGERADGGSELEVENLHKAMRIIQKKETP